MEVKLIELLIVLVCSVIFLRGVLMPLGKLTYPIFASFVRFVFSLLQKSEVEKQEEALQRAKEHVRIAEIQREAVKTEKKAMKIQESIIDEEFEELNEEKKFRT